MYGHRGIITKGVNVFVPPLWRRRTMRPIPLTTIMRHNSENFNLYCSTSSSRHDGNNNNDDNAKIAHYLKDILGIDASLHRGIHQAFESIHGKQNVTLEHVKALGKEDIQALAQSVQIEMAKKKKKETNYNQEAAGTTETKKMTPRGRPSLPIVFKVPHQRRRDDNDINDEKPKEIEVTWRLGDTLLNVAQNNVDILGQYMEGSCGGTMSCTTCHIYLEQINDYNALGGTPQEGELDMLDLAYEAKEDCSRLGCQVKLSPSILNGLKCSMTTTTAPADPTAAEVSSSMTNHRLEVTIPPGVYDVWDVNNQ